jgi:uncharacterized protein YjdB
MTDIEKACKGLISIDNYVRECVKKDQKVTGTTIRNRIRDIKLGKITAVDAGFVPHRIANKYFLEVL